MPDGKTHLAYLRRNTPLVIFGGLVVSWILMALWFGVNDTLPFEIFVGYMGYCVGYVYVAKYIDPDSDLLGMTESEGRLMRNLGCFGFAMVWWMFPYAYIMKWFGGHRGVSHWHVIGTLSRALWIAWVPALLYIQLGIEFPFYMVTVSFLVGVLLGLIVADSIHVHLDNHPPRKHK